MSTLLIIILIVIVLLIVIWIIKVQNKLVSIDELCGNAMSQIGVQQNSRWDVLITLAKQTKQYSEHEYKILMDVAARRQGVSSMTDGLLPIRQAPAGAALLPPAAGAAVPAAAADRIK